MSFFAFDLVHESVSSQESVSRGSGRELLLVLTRPKLWEKEGSPSDPFVMAAALSIRWRLATFGQR